jgi:hypothetical protein
MPSLHDVVLLPQTTSPITFSRELNVAMLKAVTYDATLRQRAMREMVVFVNLSKVC